VERARRLVVGLGVRERPRRAPGGRPATRRVLARRCPWTSCGPAPPSRTWREATGSTWAATTRPVFSPIRSPLSPEIAPGLRRRRPAGSGATISAWPPAHRRGRAREGVRPNVNEMRPRQSAPAARRPRLDVTAWTSCGRVADFDTWREASGSTWPTRRRHRGRAAAPSPTSHTLTLKRPTPR